MTTTCASDKPENRVPVSLRIPPKIAEAVEAYASRNGVRKTDTYVHFLQLGLQPANPVSEGEGIEKLQMQMDEVLCLLRASR